MLSHYPLDRFHQQTGYLDMFKYIKNQIEKHALSEYPKECCGLIIAVGNKQKYIPCTNQSQAKDAFKISAEEYAETEDKGQILSVVHSHINETAKPSQLDLSSCEASGLPWHIVAVGMDAGDSEPSVTGWESIEPEGYCVPLVGREFFHGSLDCYGLVRDFYRAEMGIELMDFDRPDYWWEDSKSGELYLDNFEKAGFYKVNGEPKFGDLIIMQYMSDKANHGGVYIGDKPLKTQPELHVIPNAMLHHPMPRLSERVMYNGYWKDITRVIVRHKDA